MIETLSGAKRLFIIFLFLSLFFFAIDCIGWAQEPVIGQAPSSFLPPVEHFPLPEVQPGDDEAVPVTVGEMRQALAYKEEYESLLMYVNSQLIPPLNNLIESNRAWKIGFLGLFAGTLLAITSFTIGSFTNPR